MGGYVQILDDDLYVQEILETSLDKTSQCLLYKLRHFVKKCNHACSQIVLLTNQIELIRGRITRRERPSDNIYHNELLHLNLDIHEGLRLMYYNYVNQCADRIDYMETDLLQRGVLDAFEMIIREE